MMRRAAVLLCLTLAGAPALATPSDCLLGNGFSAPFLAAHHDAAVSSGRAALEEKIGAAREAANTQFKAFLKAIDAVAARAPLEPVGEGATSTRAVWIKIAASANAEAKELGARPAAGVVLPENPDALEGFIKTLIAELGGGGIDEESAKATHKNLLETAAAETEWGRRQAEIAILDSEGDRLASVVKRERLIQLASIAKIEQEDVEAEIRFLSDIAEKRAKLAVTFVEDRTEATEADLAQVYRDAEKDLLDATIGRVQAEIAHVEGLIDQAFGVIDAVIAGGITFERSTLAAAMESGVKFSQSAMEVQQEVQKIRTQIEDLSRSVRDYKQRLDDLDTKKLAAEIADDIADAAEGAATEIEEIKNRRLAELEEAGKKFTDMAAIRDRLRRRADSIADTRTVELEEERRQVAIRIEGLRADQNGIARALRTDMIAVWRAALTLDARFARPMTLSGQMAETDDDYEENRKKAVAAKEALIKTVRASDSLQQTRIGQAIKTRREAPDRQVEEFGIAVPKYQEAHTLPYCTIQPPDADPDAPDRCLRIQVAPSPAALGLPEDTAGTSERGGLAATLKASRPMRGGDGDALIFTPVNAALDDAPRALVYAPGLRARTSTHVLYDAFLVTPEPTQSSLLSRFGPVGGSSAACGARVRAVLGSDNTTLSARSHNPGTAFAPIEATNHLDRLREAHREIAGGEFSIDMRAASAMRDANWRGLGNVFELRVDDFIDENFPETVWLVMFVGEVDCDRRRGLEITTLHNTPSDVDTLADDLSGKAIAPHLLALERALLAQGRQTTREGGTAARIDALERSADLLDALLATPPVTRGNADRDAVKTLVNHWDKAYAPALAALAAAPVAPLSRTPESLVADALSGTGAQIDTGLVEEDPARYGAFNRALPLSAYERVSRDALGKDGIVAALDGSLAVALKEALEKSAQAYDRVQSVEDFHYRVQATARALDRALRVSEGRLDWVDGLAEDLEQQFAGRRFYTALPAMLCLGWAQQQPRYWLERHDPEDVKSLAEVERLNAWFRMPGKTAAETPDTAASTVGEYCRAVLPG